MSFYSPPGVLGVRGFVGTEVEDVEAHEVHEDKIEHGNKCYCFDNGHRFFDLRPARTNENKFFLAHGEKQNFTRAGGKVTKLGYIGGIGEPLEAVLDDIWKFAKNPGHEKELIVLKFSHGADWSNPEAGELSGQHKQELLETIRGKLDKTMIRHVSPEQRVDTIPIENLMRDGQTVLCVFEESLNPFTQDQRKGSGIYLYDDTNKGETVNYKLYDDYSNSRNPAKVMGDQWCKFRDRMRSRVDKNEDEVFLLSWTITLTPSPALMDMRSIIDHARFINGHLPRAMESWIQRGDIVGRKRPNIIYVDAYDERIVKVVTKINALPL